MLANTRTARAASVISPDGLIQFDDGRTVFTDHATGGNDSHLRLLGYVVDAAQDMRRLFQRGGQPLVRILRQLCIRFCKPADARQRLVEVGPDILKLDHQLVDVADQAVPSQNCSGFF